MYCKASLYSNYHLINNYSWEPENNNNANTNKTLINSKPTYKESMLYKTELCRNWTELGHCRYDKKCRFAHGTVEQRMVSRHGRYKTQICRAFHMDGSCSYGTRCTFVHNCDLGSTSTTHHALLNKLRPYTNRRSSFDSYNDMASLSDENSSISTCSNNEQVFSTMRSNYYVCHNENNMMKQYQYVETLYHYDLCDENGIICLDMTQENARYV